MRAAHPMTALLFALGLCSSAAFAQSEDEQILKEGQPSSTTPPPEGDSAPSGGTDKAPPTNYTDEELDEQVFYSGLGVERASSDYDNLKDAVNLVATLGFRIPTAPWFGVELDLDQTMIPGEYREPRNGTPFIPGTCTAPNFPPGCTPDQPAKPAEDGAFDAAQDDFQMFGVGLSLALKTTGRFYVTGKYGYRYLLTNNDTLEEEGKSGSGLGAGIGYRWGKGLSGVELGYKKLAESVDSVGLTFFVRSRR